MGRPSFVTDDRTKGKIEAKMYELHFSTWIFSTNFYSNSLNEKESTSFQKEWSIMQLSVASFVEIQLTSLLGKGNRWLVDCKALLCFTVWLFFDFTTFKVYWLHITFSVLHNKLRKQFNDIGRLYEIKFQKIVGNIGLKLKTILKVCALPLHHFQNT